MKENSIEQPQPIHNVVVVLNFSTSVTCLDGGYDSLSFQEVLLTDGFELRLKNEEPKGQKPTAVAKNLELGLADTVIE